MIEIFVGIDPGLDGAIAAITSDSNVYFLENTPTYKIGNKRVYDEPGMVQSLLVAVAAADTIDIAIERQRSMPKQGVVSSLSIGYGFGVWVGIVASLASMGLGISNRVAWEIVEPRTWKRMMLQNLPKNQKNSSKIAARRLFPHADLGKRKTHDRSDAVLIAEFARRTWGRR